MEQNIYKDILVLVLGFVIIGLIFKLDWMVYSIVALGVFCAFVPIVATYVQKGWMAFGKFLGAINATILLSIIFFLLLTPLSFLKRLTSGKTEDETGWLKSENREVDFTKPW